MKISCSSCTVRSWRASDGLSLAHHANNRKIWLQLRDRFPHPYTLEDAETWLNFVTAEQPETNFAIAIDDQAAGGIGFVIQDDVNRYSAETGYWLGEAFWGNGIVAEALTAVSRYAFKEFALLRLYALPFADNRASCRVLEKAGYVQEALLRNSAVKNGRLKDQYIYALLAAEIENEIRET